MHSNHAQSLGTSYKKRFETDLKVRCEANDERQEIRMKMVPRSVGQFAARLSSFKIISP